jgi:hypothetical protein
MTQILEEGKAGVDQRKQKGAGITKKHTKLRNFMCVILSISLPSGLYQIQI